MKTTTKLVIVKVFILLLIVKSPELRSETFFNSNEVSLQSPLKAGWEYNTNSTLLNQKINGNVCYINTLKGIQAVSLSDGKQIWNYDFTGDGSISSVVTFSDKYGTFISYKKNKSSLTLIDLSTGKEKWSLVSDKIWYKPTAMLSNDFVFCITGSPESWNDLKDYLELKHKSSKLTAINLEDGKTAWETPMPDNTSELMKIINDFVFVSFDFYKGAPSNKLMCINAKNGKVKWEFNPSSTFGMKVMIGGVTLFNNALYTHPQYGGDGQISRLDLNTGAERWYTKKKIEKQRNFIVQNNKIYNSSEDWQSFKPANGDKLSSKSLQSSSFWSGFLTSLVSSTVGTFIGGSFTGLMVASSVTAAVEIAGLINTEEGKAPSFIPTVYLFNGLRIEDVVNDKGLFSVVRDGDEVKFISYSVKDDNDDELELLFKENEKDLCLSNGTNSNSIFASSNAKLYSIRIKDATIEWEKDFSNGKKETSLGLILNKDKMYMFTDKRILQLVNG